LTAKKLDTYLNLCSEYYDLDKPSAPADALSFYMEYARNCEGKIFEPMCGNGRFLFPILDAGLDIEGSDASSFMLEKLKDKCRKMNQNPKVWQGFLEDISQENEYELIFIPSGSFGLIIDENSALKCLHKIYNALKANGKIVFEVETLNAIPKTLGPESKKKSSKI